MGGVPPHDRASVFRTILSIFGETIFCRKTAVARRPHGFRVGINYYVCLDCGRCDLHFKCLPLQPRIRCTGATSASSYDPLYWTYTGADQIWPALLQHLKARCPLPTEMTIIDNFAAAPRTSHSPFSPSKPLAKDIHSRVRQPSHGLRTQPESVLTLPIHLSHDPKDIWNSHQRQSYGDNTTQHRRQ